MRLDFDPEQPPSRRWCATTDDGLVDAVGRDPLEAVCSLVWVIERAGDKPMPKGRPDVGTARLIDEGVNSW